jgi:hypothetical protein
MPRIPQLNTQSISTNAVDLGQGPSVTRAGVASEALGQLGNQLMNLGSNLMEKRKQAETSTFVNTKKNELNRMIAQKETELDAKYTGDPTGYSAEMGDFLKGYYEEQKDLAPNEDAKLMFDNEFNSFSTQVGLNAQTKENKRKAEYQSGLITEDAFKNRQVLAQKPDTILATDFLNNSLKSVNDGIGLYYNETQAKELKRKIGTDYAGTLLEGFESSKRYGEGLRFLNGKDADGAIMLGYTDPKQIQAYKERFTRLAEQEVELSKRVFNTQANDLSTALMQGMKVPQEVFNSVANQTQFLKPEERALVLDNLNNAKQYNQMLNDLKTMPVDKIREKAVFEIPRTEGDIFNLTARQNMASMYQKAATDMLNKKLTDGASFAIESDSTIENLSKQAMDLNNTDSMKDYANRVTEKQKLDGITNIKLLDKSMAKTYGAILTSPNTETANLAYNQIRKGYGDKAGNVISELIANEAIKPEHAMAMYLPDESARKSSLINISKKQEIDTSFEKIKKTSELSEVFDDDTVINLKNSISINDPGKNRLWLNNGIDSLLELEYKAARVNGSTEKEAKEVALNKVIKNNFSVANSKNSSVVLTKEYIPHQSKIQDYMTETLNPINVKNLKVTIPKSYTEQMRIMGNEGQELSQYYNDLSKNGVWLTNNSQNGVRLAKKTASGGYAQVLDDKGKPIEISYDDMIKTNVKRISRREGF